MKKIFGLVSFLLLTTVVNAQILWQISGNGLAKPSYVIGTHHLAPLSSINSVEGLQSALNETQQVYGEVIASDMQTPENVAYMSKKMVMQGDTTLKSLFSTQEFEEVNTFCKNNIKLDLNSMLKMKPSFISMLISIYGYSKNHGLTNSKEQIDTYLQNKALEAGKKVGGLESVQFQVDMLFDSGSQTDNAKWLLWSVKNFETSLKITSELTACYINHDLECMSAVSDSYGNKVLSGLSDAEKAQYQKAMADLLDQRNANWVEIMPAIMNTSPTFFAVGALHLPGEAGLLNLLKKKGFTIKPVK